MEVKVPPILAQFLRPHQREGVSFLYECVMNMRDYDGQGCILADDMGLGKTLQSIAALYTLIQCDRVAGEKLAKRIIVVCPCALVKNWDAEFAKWVNGRLIGIPTNSPEYIRQIAIAGL